MNGKQRRRDDKCCAVYTPGQTAQRCRRGKRARDAEDRTGHETNGRDQSQSRVAEF
jgi:hypothetical protein